MTGNFIYFLEVQLKTYKHLYPRVHDFLNLYIPHRKARKEKRDTATIRYFCIRLIYFYRRILVHFILKPLS